MTVSWFCLQFQGLLQMKFLPRLRYILEVFKPSSPAVRSTLQILIRIARHSAHFAAEVTRWVGHRSFPLFIFSSYITNCVTNVYSQHECDHLIILQSDVFCHSATNVWSEIKLRRCSVILLIRFARIFQTQRCKKDIRHQAVFILVTITLNTDINAVWRFHTI